VEIRPCGLEKTRAQTKKHFLFFYVSWGGNVGFPVGKCMSPQAETYGFRIRDVENERADGGMDRGVLRLDLWIIIDCCC
jgi:hypothetical protein